MDVQQFKSYLHELFGPLLTAFQEDEEYGFCNFTLNHYERIAYATNITPELIAQAAEHNVQMLITHHDAWDFVYGMKEKCVELLNQYQIAHCYIHLPLDYVEFGTCTSLLKRLGVSKMVQYSRNMDGYSAIGIGELETPVALEKLVGTMTDVLGEKVFFQKNSNQEIKRIGMVTGAGNGTDQLKEALDSGCDVYITGEKTLYTVQYAKFINLNIMVGSHTFTEIFGVESLAQKLKERFDELEIIQLQEEHNEVIL
ncbi:Nif3-like dinuclear metal center hexameric protein [Paenibacillus filicis]|uniref:GTP cyclohydrolase 1 type 2 homolog n=2 Tax=Paenibacillus filicis TaxID=669464 RepID=A0ABU9DTH9_9BACL